MCSTIYVNDDGYCNGNSPCYASISDGYLTSCDDGEIKVSAGFYLEELTFSEPIEVILSGGWNNDYSDNTGGQSTIGGSLTISGGTVIIDKVVIEGTTSLTRAEEQQFGCWLPKYWSKLALLK